LELGILGFGCPVALVGYMHRDSNTIFLLEAGIAPNRNTA